MPDDVGPKTLRWTANLRSRLADKLGERRLTWVSWQHLWKVGLQNVHCAVSKSEDSAAVFECELQTLC